MNKIPLRLALVGLAGFWLIPNLWGQATLHTILSNGVPAARYNVVVLAEGYTAGQLGTFRTDATNAMTALFSREPFKEYQPYFNAFAIAVASAQSGSDHPSYPLYRDTYFSSSYDASDILITIPASAQGQGRAEALLNTHVPEWDLAILLVNDPVPGGSDGSDKIAITSTAGIADILVHEIGHVLAGLGDEYTTPLPGFPDDEEPNTTRETSFANVKWSAWIAETTPLPTPATDDYQDVVGLFEGAHYHATGWYRPKLNCIMRSQYTPEFCEVCREALVLSICKIARPITVVIPSQQRLVPGNSDPIAFKVSLQKPRHDLLVEWRLNGQLIPGATNTNCTIFPATLPGGTNTIESIVIDPTEWVRTDPAGLLRQTNFWTLRNDLPYVPPDVRLAAPGLLAGGSFGFDVTGTAMQAIVESSTNLVHWVPLATLSLVNGPCRFTNSTPSGAAGLFFRGRPLQP